MTPCRFRTEDAMTTTAPRLNQTHSSLNDVIRALFAALHAKDPATCSHSARVALIAVMLCDQMQLGPQISAIVSSAGILHDIGKMGIPDVILRKPEPLTPDEVDLMKTHAVVGWTLYSQFHFLQLGSPMNVAGYSQPWLQ